MSSQVCAEPRDTTQPDSTPGENPVFLACIRSPERREKFSRAIGRIWEAPDLHFNENPLSAIADVVKGLLAGTHIHPDSIIVEFAHPKVEARPIFDTLRSFTTLRDAPLIALTENTDTELENRLYGAGADLVIAWGDVEPRISDIAGFVIGKWMTLRPEERT